MAGAGAAPPPEPPPPAAPAAPESPLLAALPPRVGGAAAAAPAAAARADGEGPAGVRDSRWHEKVRRGDARGVTRAEVDELFRAVDPGHEGSVDLAALRGAVAETCPPQSVRFMDEALAASGALGGGRVDGEQFLQAMRLGSPGDVRALAARLRGRDPLEAAGRLRGAPLAAYLRSRKERRDNCLSLPFTLGLFALFFCLALWHFKQQQVFRLTEAVSLELPLDSLETSYPGSLWSWLDSRVGGSRLARYNKLVGGIHLAKAFANETIEDLQVLCSYNVIDYVGGLFTNGAATPQMCRGGDGTAPTDSVQWLLWPLQRQDALPALTAVRDWWQLEASVGNGNANAVPVSGPERVEVSMLAYNANLNFYVFYRLSFHIPSSGAMQLGTTAIAFEASPLWLNAKEDWDQGGPVRRLVMVSDVLFVVMYATLALQELWRLLRLCCSRCKRGSSSHCWIWSAIDWVIFLMAVLLTIMYFYCNHLTQGLLDVASGLPVPEETRSYSQSELQQLVLDTTQLSWPGYIQKLDASLEQAARLGQGQADLRWYATVFAGMLCLRFFRAFRANPRLNLVLQTLKRSASDFAHFAIVFGFLLLSFALVAHAIFGGQMEPFSTAGGALHSTFLFLLGFLLDSYKDQMYQSAGALAVLWTLAFQFIMVLILVNVIAAIIFDTYTEVKTAAGDAPSLWQQAWDVVTEWRCRKAGARPSGRALVAVAPEPDGDRDDTGRCSMDANDSFHLQPYQQQGQQRWRRLRPRDSLETRLLRVLELRDHSDKELYSVEDLCEHLGAHSWREQLQVEALFVRALEQSRCEQEAVSVSDAVRLCSRADANVRELEPMTRGLLERMQQWQVEREKLLAATAARPASPPQFPGVDEASCLVPPIPPPVPERQREHAQDPEPEPPSAALGMSQSQFLEERLEMVAKAQAQRYGRLEESIARLAQRLEPMLSGGTRDITVDPRRIQKLEEKVERLKATLSPVLDLGAPRVPQRSAMRPPTPPRALVGPAAQKLPRATTQGTGHDPLQGGSRGHTPTPAGGERRTHTPTSAGGERRTQQEI